MKNHRFIQRNWLLQNFLPSSAVQGRLENLGFFDFFFCLLLEFLRPDIFKNLFNIALNYLRFFLNFFKALGIIKNVSLALGPQNLLTFPYPVHCSHIFIIFFYSCIFINFIFITYIWTLIFFRKITIIYFIHWIFLKILFRSTTQNLTLLGIFS